MNSLTYLQDAIDCKSKLKVYSYTIQVQANPTQINFVLAGEGRAFLSYRFGQIKIWLYNTKYPLSERLINSPPNFTKSIGDQFDGYLGIKDAIKYLKEYLMSIQ